MAYIGANYPRTWDIGFLPPIHMNIEATKHYQSSGYNANAACAALSPNNGTFYLGPQRQPLSISLFHQLRCLDIIRCDIAETLPQESKLSLPRNNSLSLMRALTSLRVLLFSRQPCQLVTVVSIIGSQDSIYLLFRSYPPPSCQQSHPRNSEQTNGYCVRSLNSSNGKNPHQYTTSRQRSRQR